MPSSPGRERWSEVRRTADGIRRRVMEHVVANDGGYLSQACSAAEILATLYLETMRLGASTAPAVPPPFRGVPGPDGTPSGTGGGYNGPAGPAYDRFFLSPAHYALVLYTALMETGRMAPEGLEQFNKDGSTVEMIGAEHSPGFEMMGGSLAETLSQAAGIALARKRRDEAGRVFVFLSDGEFQEGQTWEALQAMAFYKLDAMRVYVDVNGQQCDGPTADVMNVEPLDRQIEAFGARRWWSTATTRRRSTPPPPRPAGRWWSSAGPTRAAASPCWRPGAPSCTTSGSPRPRRRSGTGSSSPPRRPSPSRTRGDAWRSSARSTLATSSPSPGRGRRWWSSPPT